jgi:choline dehydrogenase-like flavoprotein
VLLSPNSIATHKSIQPRDKPSGVCIVIGDLNDLASGETLVFDVCLVGAGPAGITIADELIGSGLKVCLVESGGFHDDPETQALYLGESVGHPVAMDEGRYRLFGGSATRWTGRCATLDPIDFEARDWVKNSGWPISLESLEPYYARAKTANNFQDPWLPDDAVLASLGIRPPKFNERDINLYIWRFAAPDRKPSIWSNIAVGRRYFDWGRAYRKKLAEDRNTHVILHANLTTFSPADDGSQIQAIRCSSLKGCSVEIKARIFVLCCGGIENVRILQNAPDKMLARINEFDNLGRYLMQHPRGSIATLYANAKFAGRLQRVFNNFLRPYRVPVQYEIGFAISEQAQRAYHILNASAVIRYESHPESPWESGKRLREAAKAKTVYSDMFRDMLNIVRGAEMVAANGYRRFFLGRELILKNPSISIVVDLEQAPNYESRITLSEKRDVLGMRQAKIDWKISELERTTARYFNKFIAQELEQLGFGRVRGANWLTSEEPVRDSELAGNYHFIGATRMSKDPTDGVVNADCRSHGVENLYISGSSVFPTGGHANPTLTIVALAIRLADHIRTRFAN